MNIVLYTLLGLYFGVSILLLGMIKDKKDRVYVLRHPFGGLMIFLFGPFVLAVLYCFPAFRQRVRKAMRAKV